MTWCPIVLQNSSCVTAKRKIPNAKDACHVCQLVGHTCLVPSTLCPGCLRLGICPLRGLFVTWKMGSHT
jgi:hypothetical protein